MSGRGFFLLVFFGFVVVCFVLFFYLLCVYTYINNILTVVVADLFYFL